MAKYKTYDYSQSVLIPVSLEGQLMPGTLEFAIHTLVENRINTSIFDRRYSNDETGRWAYDPKILLKVVLFGYSRGLISSRRIERACRENVTFMALTCGEEPDHSTIAAFVSSMREEILPLFRDVLLVCEEEGLLGGTFFALDGCKLPSNASKEWSGTIRDLIRKRENLEKKVRELVAGHVKVDGHEDGGEERPSSGRAERQGQIERLIQKAERIERGLGKNHPKMGKQGREIKSNVTDNESAIMVTSHGTIQGYNGQALVDSENQVIIHGEAFGESQDLHLIPPVLDGAKESLRAIGCRDDYFGGKILTADSNYHSPVNLKKCEEEGLDAYIPDKRFRRRDPRFHDGHRQRQHRSDRLTLADFSYQEERDEYRCPKGRVFRLQAKRMIQDGTIYRRYSHEGEGCKGCELKRRCVKGKGAKKRSNLMVPVGSVLGHMSKAMAAKVDSEKGRRIYHQRMAIAEPVFANLRILKAMNRFTLRGKIKVNIQWLLYCMVHNIGKILNSGLKYAYT